jgi:polyisoprenoid-binding protein YceI
MRTLLATALAALAFTSCVKESNNETKYLVNEASSKVEWKGSAPDHFHLGRFSVKGSVVTKPNGVIKAGDLVIPIASIDNYDLPDEVKPQLLSHLKSADFFNMALHPEATFKILQVTPYSGGDSLAIAGANYLVSGNFTMLGETRRFSFPARVSIMGDSLKTEADFSIDRTNWGMKSYSDPKGELFILPWVDLHLDIRTARVK